MKTFFYFITLTSLVACAAELIGTKAGPSTEMTAEVKLAPTPLGPPAPECPVTSAIPGDYNNDGYISGADITIRIDECEPFFSAPDNRMPVAACFPCDLNHDGYYTGADITIEIDSTSVNWR